MKICFIWVRRFRNFEDFGLNLSSTEKFSYADGELRWDDVSPLPVDFFGREISEVTGIIGRNGSGKSNALELICHATKGGRTSIGDDFLIVTLENGKYVCHYAFASLPPPMVPQEMELRVYDQKFCSAKVAYFSNVYDERRTTFHNDIADISLNTSVKRSLSSKKQITSFEKQIRLVNSKMFRNLDIDLPPKVQLISKLWSARTAFRIENSFSEYSSEMKVFRSSFRERARDITTVSKFVALLKFGYFIEAYISYDRIRRADEGGARKFFRGLKKLFGELSIIRSTEEISDKLIEYLEDTYTPEQLFSPTELSNGKYRQGSFDFSSFREQLYFIRNIKEMVSELRPEYYSEGLRARNIEYFTFNYQSKEARRFISDYTELFGKAELFEIDWVGISSGHKAYLNIFASLYQELKATRQETLVLCIDEGDLYLHPSWQVEFFDKLTSNIPNLFPGKVHLVLTSHSPFLLSDLPRQNITILDPMTEGGAMNGIDLSFNTFGGNLYDLYSEPFFLGSKRTSDFAYRKIKEIVEKVESGNLLRSEKNDILRNVSNYGDDVIQFRLREMLKK
ncbi:AAA family ATPase [Pseudoduganella sp. UC29_106]|uniref:AAA family ATPase n=1 Tax=Pseudoduganella sp. UC29_106 TaxID=3374553 RepID=UPI003756CB16